MATRITAMKNEEIYKLLSYFAIPPLDERKANLCADNAIREWRAIDHKDSAKEANHFTYWKSVGVLATVLFMIALWPVFITSEVHDETNLWKRETILISELSNVFPDRLQAIVEENGDISPMLSETPVTWNKQPLIVTFQSGERQLRVISFSGQQLRINLHGQEIILDAFATAKGEVLLVLDDIVVFQNNEISQFNGYKVKADIIGSSI